MATLRRMSSLDCAHNVSSSLHTHLVRHSSLPNLFLCQPELAMAGVLSRFSSFPTGSLHTTSLEGSSFHTSSKFTLCRAMSSNRGFDYDEFSELCEVPSAGVDAHTGRGFGPQLGSERMPVSSKKKKLAMAGADQSLDLEKSVVYSELRESMCGLAAPPKFFKPFHESMKGLPQYTLHEDSKAGEQYSSQNRSDLHMQKCSTNDVKGRPMSLRMLKRKLSKIPPQADSDRQCNMGAKKAFSHNGPASEWASHRDTKPQFIAGVGDSVFSALTSLLYMLKMLQQYALSPCLQSHNGITVGGVDEKYRETWVARAYAEMLDSFLWLFQQVFSCTPKLMLLTMMLLADFTLHSVSKHVAFPVMPLGEPPTTTALAFDMGKHIMDVGGIFIHEEQQSMITIKHQQQDDFPEAFPGELGGGCGVGAIKHGSSHMDNDGFILPLRKMTPERRVGSLDRDDVSISRSSLLSLLPPAPSSSSLQIAPAINGADLDATTKNMLVAPVRAPVLEADNYPCFDRTDLAYQDEISKDPGNPLLLANYAQFLHLVKHDHIRAEKLYRRAVMADSHGDGEVMGKFASFLWVAKGDVAEADNTYKAAMEVDPTNVYHAGCYAHFLWSSSAR